MKDTDNSICSVKTQSNLSMYLSTIVEHYATNDITVNSSIKDMTVTTKNPVSLLDMISTNISIFRNRGNQHFHSLTGIVSITFPPQDIFALKQLFYECFEKSHGGSFLYEYNINQSKNNNNKSRVNQLKATGFNTYKDVNTEWTVDSSQNQKTNTVILDRHIFEKMF